MSLDYFGFSTCTIISSGNNDHLVSFFLIIIYFFILYYVACNLHHNAEYEVLTSFSIFSDFKEGSSIQCCNIIIAAVWGYIRQFLSLLLSLCSHLGRLIKKSRYSLVFFIRFKHHKLLSVSRTPHPWLPPTTIRSPTQPPFLAFLSHFCTTLGGLPCFPQKPSIIYNYKSVI